ncbi:MAG: F420-non-reducing hydrogenase large subunit [Clostridia bacterium]|nr:F420-non-reducing hydrogenase large subunit [Clostridia bacterium]
MAKKIVIQPVTRIEGHARVTIILDDRGQVQDARVQVVELRGFEKFCVGRPVEEMPRLVTRICGVCPWSHHLAAARAADALFGVQIPETARKIRELAYAAHFIHSHLLHFFFLAGADLLGEPGTGYQARNIIGLAARNPALIQRVVRVRHLAQQMTEIIAGKAIHPDAAVPGGFSRPLREEQRQELLPMARECLDFTRFALDWAKDKVFAPRWQEIKQEQPLETGFLGMVAADGGLNFYDGKLRLRQVNGEYQEFEPQDYQDYIGEHREDWTYVKFPFARSAGRLSLDPDNPVGVYRTNSLARLNVCDFIPTPLAQKELLEFRAAVGDMAQHTFLYHWARLIEALYAAERVVELLEDPGITGLKVREKVEPRAGRGVGVVEAPRGTLIHDYEADAKGFITRVNLIVGTTHNNAAINIEVFRTARRVLEGGQGDEEALNRIEMAIRAFDPCFSCATHKIDGSLAVRVEIMDSCGQVIKMLQN